MKIDVTLHAGPELLRQLDRIEMALDIINERFEAMTLDVSRLLNDEVALSAAITRLLDLAKQAVTANLVIAQQLRDLQASTDDTAMQAQIDAVAAKLEADTASISEAIDAATIPTPAE